MPSGMVPGRGRTRSLTPRMSTTTRGLVVPCLPTACMWDAHGDVGLGTRMPSSRWRLVHRLSTAASFGL